MERNNGKMIKFKLIMAGVMTEVNSEPYVILGDKVENDLVIKNSDDMKHFKQTTQGGVVIMGRATFESMNCRPLPNRINIVVGTRSNIKAINGIEIVYSLKDAFELVREKYINKNVFVIGGARIYKSVIKDYLRFRLGKVYLEEILLTQMVNDYISIKFMKNPDNYAYLKGSDFYGVTKKIKSITFDENVILDEEDAFRTKYRTEIGTLSLRERYSPIQTADSFNEKLTKRGIKVVTIGGDCI